MEQERDTAVGSAKRDGIQGQINSILRWLVGTLIAALGLAATVITVFSTRSGIPMRGSGFDHPCGA